jgi:hypothetical protein
MTTEATGPYNGNGTTVVFSYTFLVQDPADLTVTVTSPSGVSVIQTLNIDYTVSGVSNPTGGQITMVVPPPVGSLLLITNEPTPNTGSDTSPYITTGAAYGFDRPGDASELFDFGDATVAQNIYGSVIRFTKAGKLTTRGLVAIEVDDVYTYRVRYSRSLDSGDPANDGLQFGIDLLNGFGNLLGERTLASDNTLLVQSQERSVEVKLATSTLPSAEVILPSSVKYVRPWVKVYGIGHQTDIEVCGVAVDPPPGAQGVPGPNAEITVSGAPAVARTFYVTMSGNDNNDGSTLYAPLATIGAGLAKAAALEEPAVVIVHPGEYIVQPDTEIPRNCALYGYDLRTTKLSLPFGFEENNMFLMTSGIKVRGFTFSGLRHEEGWDLETPPQKGFAFAFKPGEIITRSPYIADCSQLHSFTQDEMTLPIDKAAGNPLMPRGGGNIIADGSVLGPSSPLRSVVVDSFTAINPNGVGYLMIRDAFVQLVSVFTNWSRVGLWAHQGGQVTVANSNNTFGDYALASTGFRNILQLPDFDPLAPLGVYEPAADQIALDADTIINNMYAQLASEFVEVQNFTVEQEALTRRDAATLLKNLVDDLRSGQERGIRYFIRGLFDWNAEYHFDPALLPIFLRSYEILLAEIKLRPPQVILPAEDMLDYLFAFLAAQLSDPQTTGFPSVIEATGQQFSYAGTGVNYNSLPISQRGTGRASDPTLAIYKDGGGRVYATFSTETGDTYLGEDLRVDFERNTIEGQAFSRGVQNIALPLIIGVGG